MKVCLFSWTYENIFVILLLYVDNMFMASNDTNILIEIKVKLMNEFEMTD